LLCALASCPLAAQGLANTSAAISKHLIPNSHPFEPSASVGSRPSFDLVLATGIIY
jgi:hypothetical protein